MITIENTQECYVQLWRKLERTRQLFHAQFRRYCIRNVLRAWFGREATDDFIWQVCRTAMVDEESLLGNDPLPPPTLYPRQHRELLRAIVAVKLGISYYKSVNLRALDRAYSVAFPKSTPLNISKKGK